MLESEQWCGKKRMMGRQRRINLNGHQGSFCYIFVRGFSKGFDHTGSQQIQEEAADFHLRARERDTMALFCGKRKKTKLEKVPGMFSLNHFQVWEHEEVFFQDSVKTNINSSNPHIASRTKQCSKIHFCAFV